MTDVERPGAPLGRTFRSTIALWEGGRMATSIGSIVWGVRDVPRAIEFWSNVLDYEPRDEPSDDWAVLVPREGPGVQLAVMLVDSEPSGHRRHHLDLYSSDREAEIERILSLGASHVDWQYEEDADYVVLSDPDGNLFDVIEAG